MEKIAQETSPSYQQTTPETGAGLPAYMEPFIFPRYNTDDVREQSLLDMADDIAETIVAEHQVGTSWQDTFNRVLEHVDPDLTNDSDFLEVRRHIWQSLPDEVQIEVQY